MWMAGPQALEPLPAASQDAQAGTWIRSKCAGTQTTGPLLWDAHFQELAEPAVPQCLPLRAFIY